MKDQSTFSGTLIAFVILILGAAIAAYLLPENIIIWRGLAGLAALAFLAHVVLGRETYTATLGKRTTKLGLTATLNAFIVIAIAVVINLIATGYKLSKDVTKNKLHSLSEQSVKVVSGLKDEVVLKAFANPNQIQEFEKIFDKWTTYSKKLRREFVDVDKDPMVVKKYNIRQAGTIIVESGDRNVRVENISGADDPKLEEKITNAIISVTKGGKKKLYFTSGHGERLLSDAGREGLSQMKEELEATRYQVEELVLLEKQAIPADAEIVLLAAPRSAFLEPELKALETYVRGGGKLLVMIEPNSSASMKAFLAKFGAEWKPNKVILETNSLQQLAGGNPLAPIIASYDKSSDITKDLNQISLFPLASPIEKTKEAPAGMKITSLFSTSPRSMEVELKGNKVNPQEKDARKGPLSLALSVAGNVEGPKAEPTKEEAPTAPGEEPKTKEFRVVIVGDADFAANGGRTFGVNSDLFQNMMAWLAHEEDLIAVRPKSADESQLEITEVRMRVLNLASMLVLPLLSLIAGVAVWISRRRK